MKKIIVVSLSVLLFCSCRNKPSSSSSNYNYEKNNVIDDGFTKKDRRSSSSSAKSLKVDDENATLENYLRQMPGLNVTGSGYNATVTVRGVKTMYGASEALFVVDGVPLSGGLGQVQGLVEVRDIASLNVLKDGSATAIYGNRGGNGVIVIKTKK
jgi:TonB-dependent starch-binding outer membrane protein SusC